MRQHTCVLTVMTRRVPVMRCICWLSVTYAVCVCPLVANHLAKVPSLCHGPFWDAISMLSELQRAQEFLSAQYGACLTAF